MSTSLRLKCVERHINSRRGKTASLNMVSLMDIFTILVFFLLVSSVDSEILPAPKAVSLPRSIASQQPKKTLVVMVNEQDIRINGLQIVPVNQVNTSVASVIPQLLQKLQDHASKELTENPGQKRLSITIMGDREIPYDLLKKIMLTCTSAKYSNISLAVIQKQLASH